MKKAFVYTFGCKVNQYESQQITEKLAKDGYGITNNPEEAEVSVVNSCTVTAQADRQCRNIVRQIRRKNPKTKIILTGCYAERERPELAKILPETDAIQSKIEFLGEDFRKNTISNFSKHTRAFIKIQDGCNAFCSYCIVPYVRPALYSKPVAAVLEEIKSLAANGYPEIVLTGIHIGKYEFGLTALLESAVKIPGNFRIRLSSIEVNEIDERLLSLTAGSEGKICPHFHIPLQSASQNVLKKMNRHYSPEEFRKKIELVMKCLPDAGINTDVIVGFPGETEKDFKETAGFLETGGFSRLHVFKYSPRPGTAAAGFSNKITDAEITERAQILAEKDKTLQKTFWKRFIGKERLCILEGSSTLMTDNYIKLNFEPDLQIRYSGIIKCQIFEKQGKPWGKCAAKS